MTASTTITTITAAVAAAAPHGARYYEPFTLPARIEQEIAARAEALGTDRAADAAEAARLTRLWEAAVRFGTLQITRRAACPGRFTDLALRGELSVGGTDGFTIRPFWTEWTPIEVEPGHAPAALITDYYLATRVGEDAAYRDIYIAMHDHDGQAVTLPEWERAFTVNLFGGGGPGSYDRIELWRPWLRK